MRIRLCPFIVLLSTSLSPLAWANNTSHENWQNFGDYGRYALPAAAVLLTAYNKDLKGIQQFALSMLAVQASTEALKRMFPETRPRGGSNMSFPSGHTSAAFTGAAFIHKRYGWRLAIPAYVGATLVGVSRVEVRAHYTHDVVAGAVLAIGLTWLITTPFECKNIEIMPLVHKDFVGLAVSTPLD